MEKIEQSGNLFHRERRSGLLTVPEGGIRHEEIPRGIYRHHRKIEIDLWHFSVWEYIPQKVRFSHLREGTSPYGTC